MGQSPHARGCRLDWRRPLSGRHHPVCAQAARTVGRRILELLAASETAHAILLSLIHIYGNAELYIKFIDRAADRIADYIAQTTVRDFEQMHGLPITNVHETFFTLIVGLISLIRSHPNISDRTIKEVMAQTLHIESYVV